MAKSKMLGTKPTEVACKDKPSDNCSEQSPQRGPAQINPATITTKLLNPKQVNQHKLLVAHNNHHDPQVHVSEALRAHHVSLIAAAEKRRPRMGARKKQTK